MKYLTFQSLMVLVCGIFLFSCSDNEAEEIELFDSVDLYLIDSFSKMPNSCKIDENSIIVQDSPLIHFKDFLTYDPSNYVFELSEEAIQAIGDLEPSVRGVPFAVKGDDEIIYTGYFWVSYSSYACDWTRADMIYLEINKKLKMSHGLGSGSSADDRRNDERLLQVFRSNNKLR